jgi:DNA-binding transcriptional MerR regulator
MNRALSGYTRGNGSGGARCVMPATNKKNGKAKTAEVVIPDRLYFRIGEVADLCKLPAYVLRFWETEFPQLKPTKSSTGQRMYRRSDVVNVLRIKKLLYEEGFTIAGARAHLKEEAKTSRNQTALPFAAIKPPVEDLKRLRQGLTEILGILTTRH